jgi:hypothetical protein
MPLSYRFQFASRCRKQDEDEHCIPVVANPKLNCLDLHLVFVYPDLGVVNKKDNNYSVGSGMQQALWYAEILDIPFVYSSNGKDKTASCWGWQRSRHL